MSTVQIDIALVTESFKTALQSATNQTKSFSNSASQSFASVGNSFQVMAGSLAASAIQSALMSIKNVLSSVIDEAAQSEQAIQNLNIALKSAGLYSKKSSKDLQDFAGQLQAVTIYSDEAIMSSIGLFASLTNLDQGGIKRATQAAADLAASMGYDLATATDMIAKAINGNTVAFSKIGITIQKADTDAARLENTLKALSKQHGAAAGASNTFEGAVQKSKNQMSELLESIGKLVTQNPAVIKSINDMSKAFAKAAEWVEKNKADILLFGKSVLIAAGLVAGGMLIMGVASIGLSGTLGILATAARAAWTAITGPIGLAVIAIAALGPAIFGVIKYWDEIKAAAVDFYDTNKTYINLALTVFYPFIGILVQVIQNWDQLRSATLTATASVFEYAAAIAGVFSPSTAQAIRDRATAFREEAKEIDKSIEAARIKAEQDKINAANIPPAVVVSTDEDKAAAEQAEQRRKELALERAELARANNNKLETARIQAANINAIEQERLLAEQEILTQAEQAKAETVAGFDATKLEQTLTTQQAQLLARQEHERKLLELQIAADLNKAKLESDSEARKKAVDAANDKAALDRAKLNAKQQTDVLKNRVKSEELTDKQREDGQRSTLDTIATLQSSSNKELAAIGKAAAISTATIDGYLAVQKALATVPYPFNFAAAALVGVATAANVAKIAGVNFADGGIVGGSSNTGDRIRANLNSGEMVLNRNQQATLFKIANSGSSSAPVDNTQTNNLLTAILNAVQSSTSIQIDGREIISVVRDGISSGRSIA